MQRKVIILILLLIARIALFAQDSDEVSCMRPINSFNLNLLGDASLISINYDKQFVVREKFIVSGTFGVGYNEEFCLFCDNPEAYLTFPIHISGNLGKKKHFFEFGLGLTIIPGNKSIISYPIVGYRILSLQSGKLNFRIFTEFPFTGIESTDIIFVPFGISLGVSL